MGAVRFGDVEVRLGTIPREAEVGSVEHGQELTVLHAISLVLQHSIEPRRNLGNNRHFGPGIKGARQRQRFRQVAHDTAAVRTGTVLADFDRRGRFGLGT